MEPVIFTLSAVAFAVIVYAILPPPPVESYVPLDTLIYCRTCGCLHRRQWMTWDNSDYRCTVCCSHR